MSLRTLLVMGLLICSTANAKMFRNAYVSFELPPNWNCKLEGSEWVCENDFAQKTKEAIIILTAKEVGPTDTLPAYLAHLQTPRTLPGRGGLPVKSQVINVKNRMIANQMWVDGMHLGSEVGPYFTRYVATIKDRISILVTLSAHKQHYTKYSNDFMKAVESLRVVATKDTLPGANAAAEPGETFGGPVVTSTPSLDSDDFPDEGRAKGGNGYLILILIALVLAAAGIFYYVKSNQPKKGKSKSSKK